jgi:hypothetical protein
VKSITNVTGSITFSRYGEMIYFRVVSTFATGMIMICPMKHRLTSRLKGLSLGGFFGAMHIDECLWMHVCGCSVLAAKNLGLDAYDSFLDHTYLVDRTTTIREYFQAGLGVGIMDEQPPVALRERYGG